MAKEITFDPKAPAVDEPLAVVEQEEEGGALESSFDYIPSPDDLRVPFIRLAQGLTAEVGAGTAKQGQWILPSGQVQDTVEVIIIGMRKAMAYRVENDLLCRSDDAVIGVGNPGGNCATCPLAQWTGPKEKRVAPACTMSFQYLCEYTDEETDTLAGVGIVSMSTKSASKVASQLNLYIRLHGMKNVKVTLGSTMVTKGSRRFQVPTILNVTPLNRQKALPQNVPVQAALPLEE